MQRPAWRRVSGRASEAGCAGRRQVVRRDLKPWTEQEALAWYLEKYPDGRLGAPVSTFWAGLRENPGTWLGAIGYLCFMDQVGTAVKLRPRGPPPNPKNYMQVPIARCLRNFAPRALTERTIQGLVSIRVAARHGR